MELHFTKMHGCGNDYVYISTFTQPINDFSTLAKLLSDRHFGIGGDGVIYICPSQIADVQMRMFNEDGSEGKMCGNGVRCVAKYAYDHNLVSTPTVTVETLSGIKTVSLSFDKDRVVGATVDMGKALLAPDKIPVALQGDRIVDQSFFLEEKEYRITCVGMGNPHCVTFVDNVNILNLAALGPAFEHAPIFPERVNTEFVQLLDRTHLKMRVWERGSGETFACGTGACASVVAAVENGFCDKGAPVTVSLLGGDLKITYTDESVLMEGPAVTVFEGVCSLAK